MSPQNERIQRFLLKSAEIIENCAPGFVDMNYELRYNLNNPIIFRSEREELPGKKE